MGRQDTRNKCTRSSKKAALYTQEARFASLCPNSAMEARMPPCCRRSLHLQSASSSYKWNPQVAGAATIAGLMPVPSCRGSRYAFMLAAHSVAKAAAFVARHIALWVGWMMSPTHFARRQTTPPRARQMRVVSPFCDPQLPFAFDQPLFVLRSPAPLRARA